MGYHDDIMTRFSHAFIRTHKDAPKDEVSRNAQLLVRAGYVDKLSAGVYTFLPLGLRVMKKIERIIRREMNAIGGQELLMPALHPKENWVTTGRWDAMDDLYKVTDVSGRESALGATHEEIVVPIAKNFISSYKDLPFALYQFQNKFRMELRAKSGLLRGREFLMKDLYSFHATQEDAEAFYAKVRDAYMRIFTAAGIGEKTYLTFASGGSFSKYSHEFQTLTDAGEDLIHICGHCRIAINEEIFSDQKTCPECGGSEFTTEKSVETGNIFDLKTKYSDPFHLAFKDETGALKPVLMGCYGIGLGRLMGTVVEVHADERGIVWPEQISPYQYHLIMLGGNDDVRRRADEVYEMLSASGVEVLYDDRDVSSGVKFADADLIGITRQIVIGKKAMETPGLVEVKDRITGEVRTIAAEELS